MRRPSSDLAVPTAVRPHRSAGRHRVLTTLGRSAVLGVCALLAACQTLAPGDEGASSPPPEVVQTASPEPTAAPSPSPSPSTAPVTPTAEPEEGEAGPVVNGPNSITAPAPGATVDGPTVTVTGEGTAFEATLSYRVLVAGTEEVVAESFTQAGANGEVGPYTFDVELEPGDYTVQVWEPDMSDGEGGSGPFRNLVEVTFTVG